MRDSNKLTGVGARTRRARQQAVAETLTRLYLESALWSVLFGKGENISSLDCMRNVTNRNRTHIMH